MAATFKISRIAAIAICASVMVITMVPCAHAQAVPAPAPSPAQMSDSTAVDQGIAYVLMLLALVLTYIIHVSGFPI